MVKEELANQEKLLTWGRKILEQAPSGYLKSRSRKNGAAFYRGDSGKGRSFEENITNDSELIEKLLEKKIAKETCKRAEKNIAAIRQVEKRYIADKYTDIIQDAADCYGDAALLLESNRVLDGQSRPVQHYFDPNRHIHETTCGLLVRSKSEVIITNALTSYGIPFEYEKRFPYPDEKGNYFNPDFTFQLPDGQWKIWEHLGLLKNMEYCIHNAHKLNTYQKYGYLIGRNLIITQDDQNGNCSSLYIDKMIREHLLPYYEK